MLIHFGVENYLSFKEKQVFTTLATSDKMHEDNLIKIESKKYSKINAIYGANASGKSNLFKAMQFLKEYVINSNFMLEGMVTPVSPFKFDDETVNKPSTFEIVFIKNNIRYEYSLVCDFKKVYEEYLYSYENGREAVIFERTNTNDYNFNSDHARLNELKTQTTSNKLFLTTATNWNYERTKPVVDYIINDLIIGFGYNIDIVEELEKLKQNNEFEKYKKFALNLLSQADINITDFEFESKRVEDKEGINNFKMNTKLNIPIDVNKVNFNLREINFNTFHQTIKNSKTKDYKLAFPEESLGTQNILSFTSILYDVFKYGKTLVIDELDTSMHPIIVEYIVNLFIDKKINNNNSQLIFNTHDTNLLNLDVFRRDEIWFTDKNRETGATEIFSLTDFSPRKEENIKKGYLIGRYGAIPCITNIDKLWEE